MFFLGIPAIVRVGWKKLLTFVEGRKRDDFGSVDEVVIFFVVAVWHRKRALPGLVGATWIALAFQCGFGPLFLLSPSADRISDEVEMFFEAS